MYTTYQLSLYINIRGGQGHHYYSLRLACNSPVLLSCAHGVSTKITVSVSDSIELKRGPLVAWIHRTFTELPSMTQHS
jgi:hypothetical protein